MLQQTGERFAAALPRAHRPTRLPAHCLVSHQLNSQSQPNPLLLCTHRCLTLATNRANNDRMDYYHMWVNLRDSRQDLAFAKAIDNYLGFLKSKGLLESWSLTRRKYGFGPPNLGEFHVTVATKNLAQLDEAFSLVATRDGEIETLHSPVYSMVTDFVSALDRDFPDPQRVRP